MFGLCILYVEPLIVRTLVAALKVKFGSDVAEFAVPFAVNTLLSVVGEIKAPVPLVPLEPLVPLVPLEPLVPPPPPPPPLVPLDPLVPDVPSLPLYTHEIV